MTEDDDTKPIIRKPGIPWYAEIDGADIVVRNVVSTCFGGGFDAGDNGETESGVKNDGSDPNLMGVALPIRSTEKATKGSPLANEKKPHIPWGTVVRVWMESDGEETAVECRLLDNGPNQLVCPTHAIDCTVAVARRFKPGLSARRAANSWSASGVSYRVIGGAKYILP